MLKSRLLFVGLLAVPACTVQYPYSAYPAQAPVDEWSPSTPHSAALTTEDGTVVVFVVDEEALSELTREARNLGRTVVQVRVGSDSWVTDTDRPASTGSVAVNEPTYTFTPKPLPMLDSVPEIPVTQRASVAAPEKIASSAPSAVTTVVPDQVAVVTPQPLAVDTTPQPRRYGWNTPKTVTPQPVVESTPEVVWVAPVAEVVEPTVVTEHEPTVVVEHEPTVVTEHEPTVVVEHEPAAAIEHKPTAVAEHEPVVVTESQPQIVHAPATAASVGAKTKPGFNTPSAVESQPVVEAVEPTQLTQTLPVIEPARPVTHTVRSTGPSTQLGYTAYGATSGSHINVRFNSTNRNASTLTLPKLNSTAPSSTETKSTPAKSSVSKKKTTSSFWGPKR
jgi:hypothetical protein